MKTLATNTGVIMMAIIAISGIMIFYNLDTFYASDNNASKSMHGALLVSNVEVVQRDEAGNIVAYRQGNNHIVATGMELIARQVFGCGAVGCNNTNNTITAPFPGSGGVVTYMEIGNGSGAGGAGACTDTSGPGASFRLGWDNQTLECPLSVPFGCARELALVDRNFAVEDPSPPGSDAAQINITAVATFSGGSNCDANNIGEAGFWNNVTTGPSYISGSEPGNIMFARNTFGTVNLSTSDSLELTWKFTFTDS